MGFSRGSRFGMMPKLLEVDRGEESRMRSAQAFRASHSPLKGSETGTTTSATSGHQQEELFPKSCQNTLCLKMCGALSNSCQWSSETCDSLAIPLNALPLFRREVPARYIEESAFGYMPTPTAQDGSGSGTLSIRRRGRGCKHGLNLRDWLRTFFGFVYPPATITEYMMALPTGASGAMPLETRKIHEWLRLHGKSWQERNDGDPVF